ncbi:MAG: hypothetical protein Q8914_10555 [Bacteroidota bacterium]|nr:hypothetical protein [Bacteroidota bacterium]
MEKSANCWRMDGATFNRFMEHVSGYFKISDGDQAIDFEDVRYVEIAEDDLYVVSAIFGAYSPNSHKMILAPVNPGSFIFPWLNYFTLNICEESKNTRKERHRVLLLEAV